MVFPELDEFKKELEKDPLNKEEIKWDFYCDNCGEVWDIISDHTSENISEDERDWISRQTDEGLWQEMLKEHKEWLIKKYRNKVPFDVVKKYLSKKEIDELDRIEKMEFVSKI